VEAAVREVKLVSANRSVSISISILNFESRPPLMHSSVFINCGDLRARLWRGDGP
jgi:hypothetical protein